MTNLFGIADDNITKVGCKEVDALNSEIDYNQAGRFGCCRQKNGKIDDFR